MNKELLKGLSDEQIAKIKQCKGPEEVIALAKEEGIELNEEQLEVINGGCSAVSNVLSFFDTNDCPKCGCNDVKVKDGVARCKECGYEWNRF